MKGFFFAKGGALFADGAEAEQILRGMGDGELCEIEVKRPRNINMHRKFWKLASYVADACPGVETAKQVVHVLKLETGHCVVFKVGDKLYQEPDSISFSKMDDDEFNDFYRRCVKVILTLFLPNMTEQGIIEEIERMVGIRY